MKMKWITLLLLDMFTFCAGMSEFYSSTAHMTQLIDLRKDLSQFLEVFLSELENQTNLLKSAHQYLESMTEDSYEDPENFISNPITAYKLVNQLKNAGRAIQEVTRMNISEGLEKLRLGAQLLPNETDLDGIAISILRLQELYRLDPQDMAGSENRVTLDPDETFHIAKVALENRRFKYANIWKEETIRKLDEGEDSTVNKSQVLMFLSSQQSPYQDLPFYMGNIWQSLNLDNLDLETLFQQLNPESLLPGGKAWDELQQSISSLDMSTLQLSWYSDYEFLCRGEGIKMDPKRQSRLSCKYSTGGRNPHLMYAPVKEEEEWDAPLILRYHDLMTPHEMQVIKNLARPKLSRAKVSDPISGDKISSEVRVSKSTCLVESESPVVAHVSRRIADVTGLDMETAERLQIVNYGIGGQYEPHYDTNMGHEGKRIATVLIYMSDVEVGGATVFPSIGVALPPKRGSAVVWFNLLKNGKRDSRTLHASCPVFIGSKWVATKWIHTKGQEFRRKCCLSKFE